MSEVGSFFPEAEPPVGVPEDLSERIEELRAALSQAVAEDRLDDAEKVLSELKDLKLREAVEAFRHEHPDEGPSDRIERQFRKVAAELREKGEPHDLESVRNALLGRVDLADKNRRMMSTGWPGPYRTRH